MSAPENATKEISRMTMIKQPSTQRVPFMTTNEDGDVYFAEGHIDPWRFFVAVLCDLATNCGDVEVVGLLGGSNDFTRESHTDVVEEWIKGVEHTWWRYKDGSDEEMERCEPDADGARPYTQT